MLAFKEFPQEMNIPTGTFIKTYSLDSFAGAVARANEWISANEVNIVNVESVGGHSETPTTVRVWFTTAE